jgi:hypothetical protein
LKQSIKMINAALHALPPTEEQNEEAADHSR